MVPSSGIVRPVSLNGASQSLPLELNVRDSENRTRLRSFIDTLVEENSKSIRVEDHLTVHKFLYAAFVNDINHIGTSLSSGIDPNCSNFDGRTALHVAASEGHIDIVRLLVSNGVLVSQKDRWGHTALSEAQSNFHTEVTEILHEKALNDVNIASLNESTRSMSLEFPGIDPELYVNMRDIEMIKVVGKGSFAEVYLAKWKGVKVAAKMTVLEAVPLEIIEDFKREVFLMSKLRHPNLLPLYGASIDERSIVLITEFMDHGSLESLLHKARIDRKPLPFRKCLQFTYDMALGLYYMHSLDIPIIHRDLKPGNVFLTDSNHVKIGDFGLSKAFKKDSRPGNFGITGGTGSYRYMAPENYKNLRYDEKVDVYSFAMIVFEMFANQKPFFRHSPEKAAEKASKKHDRPPIPHHVNPEIARLIEMCWTRDPKKRPTFEQIVSALAKLADELKTEKCIIS